MKYTPEFAEIIAEEETRQREALELSARETAERHDLLTQKQNEQHEQHVEVSRRIALLGEDAMTIVSLALGKVPEDAVLGRRKPITVGWFLWVRTTDHSGGEGYQFTNYYTLDARILTNDGRLCNTEPIYYGKRERNRPHKETIRRKSTLQEITSIRSDDELNAHRRSLAAFAVSHRL